jgi:hypothetical protein
MTFHDVLHHIPDPTKRPHFVRSVARCWRLRQALINGQRSRKRQADEAEALLQELLSENEAHSASALYLMHILDAAGHTSSLIECINAFLRCS